MRGILTVLLSTGLSFTNCIDVMPDDDKMCTAEFRYGVSARVVEAATGDPIADATLTLTEGDYTEVMEFLPTDSYAGAGERPGTYTLTIEIPDAETEVVSGIEIEHDGCHVIGVAFDVFVDGEQVVVVRKTRP